MHLRMLFFTLALLAAAAPAFSDDRQVLFREDFSSLDHWRPLTFPKIRTLSTYTIERSGADHVLRTESRASASAIVTWASFDVREFPRLRWRWKVRNVYEKADPRTRAGDDYPLRVDILFEQDAFREGIMYRLKHDIAKARFGEDAPHSSLVYVWASKDDPARVLVCPFTDSIMMVLLEKGAAKAGVWVDEEVDIVADYREAFKTDPPRRARIAIMNDSDNTGEAAVSWMEYIEVFR